MIQGLLSKKQQLLSSLPAGAPASGQHAAQTTNELVRMSTNLHLSVRLENLPLVGLPPVVPLGEGDGVGKVDLEGLQHKVLQVRP